MITAEMKGGGATAAALGAKTARACDSCLRRRARWFCGADDAFLCHGCDTLVHSANQLASRHERVRLQTASAKGTTTAHAAWHSGFTRKARTPRHNNNHNKQLSLQQQQQRLKEKVLFNNNTSNINLLPLVPELGGDQEQEPLLVDDDDNDIELLCRVPVFNVDHFDTTMGNINNDAAGGANVEEEEGCDLESFSEFDVDLAEFAANVENLLGVNEDSSVVSGQVFDNYKECVGEGDNKGAMVKVKDEVEFDDLESVFDMTSEELVFHWNIDHDDLSLAPPHDQEKECVNTITTTTNSSVVGVPTKEETKRERFLRLNYEEVITAWKSQGSPCPWTTGNPPKFTLDDDHCWPNCLGLSGAEGEVRSLRGQYLVGSTHGDGGREARVSRYREKRRTRLFAKKIRYEVRKLNAEKRPRMKGRFVKRTCFNVGANDFPTNYH